MDILKAYEEYAREGTDAPTKYHRYCAAGMMGACMGRRFYYQLGHIRVYPHVWICLIGQSTMMKKSTSLRIAQEIVSRVNADLILPGKFTVEKLYEIMAEKPVGIMVFNELAILTSQMGREYNVEMKSTLTDFWDSPLQSTYSSKGGGTISVNRPALSILAGSTIDWVVDAAKTKDIQGGFYPRWLFSVATESDQPDMALPPPRDEKKLSAIVANIADLRSYFRDLDDSNEFHMSVDGQNTYKAIYRDLREQYGQSPLLGPFAGRAGVYVIKLAMIAALAQDRSTTIDRRHLEYGYALIKDTMQSISEICTYELADSKTDQHMNRIRRMLRDAGDAGMTRRDLQRLGPVRMPKYLDTLLEAVIANGWAKVLPGKRVDSQVYVSLETVAVSQTTRRVAAQTVT